MDCSGNLLITTMIHGEGQGPAIAFGPGVQTTVGSGLRAPQVWRWMERAMSSSRIPATAEWWRFRPVAARRPRWAADSRPPLVWRWMERAMSSSRMSSNEQVVEVPAGGGAQTTVGSGLSVPCGVAVDGAGDVFIADAGNNRVVEVPAGGGAQITVGSGLTFPCRCGGGWSGRCLHRGYRQQPRGGGSGRWRRPDHRGQRTECPAGVAVDGAGDVFIADTGNSRVVEVPAGGGAQTTVGSEVLNPRRGGARCERETFSSQIQATVAWSGSYNAQSRRRSVLPRLPWTTPVPDSPQSVTVQNIGNKPLMQSLLVWIVSANFIQVLGLGHCPRLRSQLSRSHPA